MRAGDTAIVGGRPCEGRAREREEINSFQAMEFHFPNKCTGIERNSFVSTQHSHFSCPSFEEGTLGKHVTEELDKVEIVSGMCLFSSKIIKSSIL